MSTASISPPRRWRLTCLALLMVMPALAWANAGTPLMWASALHLVLGNIAVGVVEGLLLARLFSCPGKKAVALMIVANYLSAWVGWVFLLPQASAQSDITINNLHLWFTGLVVLAFPMSAIIELPFYAWALPATSRTWRRSLLASFTINSMSYVLLAGWYWLASGTSILIALHVVPANELMTDTGFDLVYLAPDGRQVIQSDLAGGHQRVLCSATTSPNDYLLAGLHEDRSYLQACRREDGSCVLMLGDRRNQDQPSGRSKPTTIYTFAANAYQPAQIPEEIANELPWGYGFVPTFVPASEWRLHTGFWALEGISGVNQTTGERFRFSLETPFITWQVRNATMVNEHLVICKLGADQICALDPVSRRISLIARGREPLVLKARQMDQSPAAAGHQPVDATR